ncbi:MAG TPA: hypothetical protein VN977_00765 [Candidatus Binatia bacterium]|nr:hypothetical protein [Candidatus Binatia bacterium]
MMLQEQLDKLREASKAQIPVALQNPVPVTGRTFLNGALLDEDGGSVSRE